jgi:hypothetical protein
VRKTEDNEGNEEKDRIQNSEVRSQKSEDRRQKKCRRDERPIRLWRSGNQRNIEYRIDRTRMTRRGLRPATKISHAKARRRKEEKFATESAEDTEKLRFNSHKGTKTQSKSKILDTDKH